MLLSPGLRHWTRDLPRLNVTSAPSHGSAPATRGVPPSCHTIAGSAIQKQPGKKPDTSTGRLPTSPAASLRSGHQRQEPVLHPSAQPMPPRHRQARGRGHRGPYSCHALPAEHLPVALTLAFANGINGVCFDSACAAAADRVFLAVVAVPLVGLVASILYALRPIDKDQVNA